MSSENAGLFGLLEKNEDLRTQLLALGGEALIAKLAAVGPEAFALAASSAETSGVQHALAATPATVRAALSYTFDIGAIDASQKEKIALATHSATVVTDGRQRLRLDDGARAALLIGGWHEYAGTVLRETAEGDLARVHGAEDGPEAREETVSAWMRAFLRNEPVWSLSRSVRTLNAALIARSALKDMPELGPNVPPLDELKRRRDLGELLEPLTTLTGLSQDAQGMRSDRFAGRTNELRILRSFVDELDSEGFGESLSRHVKRAARSAAATFGYGSARLLMLTGRGGLGKSTLIAKFVQDHALEDRPLLFAYLDFDCAALQARTPEQLLIETMRQLALSFPAESAVLNEQRERLRGQLAGLNNTSFHRECELFRENVAMLLENSVARSLIIVLDTTEVVQADPAAVSGIERFLHGLVGKRFPELAIVVSGRARFAELCNESSAPWEVAYLELEPLPPDEAEDMVQRLGPTLLGNDWQRRWSRTLAAGNGRSSGSREPLSLRIAVEIVRSTVPHERDDVVRRIGALGEAAHDDFVARLYMRRVQEHIADPRARKLAWPGLVARRMSPEIATNVLAPLCGLTATEAALAFAQLGTEVWIVVHEDGALRHRPDLRARILPLMRQRQKDKDLFYQVASAMVEYHSHRAREQGPVAQRRQNENEAIYYRLLRGDDPRLLNDIWSPELASFLATVEDDFEEGSPPRTYFRARTATHPLPYREFVTLSDELAWWHLAQACSSLRGFEDERADARVVNLLRRPASLAPPFSDAAIGARQSILIKGGGWHGLSFEPSGPRLDVDVSAVAFVAMTGVAELWQSPSLWLQDLANATKGSAQPSIRTLAYGLRPASAYSAGLFERLDIRLAAILREGASTASNLRGALRVAIAFGRASMQPALQRYVQMLNESDAAFSASELAPLLELDPLHSELPVLGATLRDIDPEDETPRRYADARVRAAVARQLTLLSEHPIVHRSPTDISVRRFAAARVEDLAVPVGYAIAVACGDESGRLSGRSAKVFSDRLREHGLRSGSRWTKWMRGNSGDATADADPVRIARAADEAGDLIGLLGDAAMLCEGTVHEANLRFVSMRVSACMQLFEVAAGIGGRDDSLGATF
ncbi:hypothetical protein [Cupriavidus basilensis]|uniref:hypothetical protein n=1 Tax=Cupriavidus basilensis TaxID=68895 RepID=UPI0023E88575|nr:hypothetical protein [Cupriavidus basilensis]MDF3886679.1 hypothetical protein [Cupriavidus basilensis]